MPMLARPAGKFFLTERPHFSGREAGDPFKEPFAEIPVIDVNGPAELGDPLHSAIPPQQQRSEKPTPPRRGLFFVGRCEVAH